MTVFVENGEQGDWENRQATGNNGRQVERTYVEEAEKREAGIREEPERRFNERVLFHKRSGAEDLGSIQERVQASCQSGQRGSANTKLTK